MANHINMWASEFTYDGYPLDPIISETKPEIDGKNFYAVINLKRVHGYKYMPYTAGSEQWRKSANRQLADHARSNFEKR